MTAIAITIGTATATATLIMPFHKCFYFTPANLSGSPHLFLSAGRVKNTNRRQFQRLLESRLCYCSNQFDDEITTSASFPKYRIRH
jgi:hypothetical protein